MKTPCSLALMVLLGLVACSTPSLPPKAPVVRPTAKAIKLPAFDFNHPPRSYQTRTLAGWEVLIEKQLIDEDPLAAHQATVKLATKLTQISETLPGASLAKLRTVRIFLLYGAKATGGGRDSSFQYFRTGAPKSAPYLDVLMTNSILIFSAYNYNYLDELWSAKGLMHELAHAWHFLQWPEREAGIYDVWAGAMEADLYRSDVSAEAKNIASLRYAAQNHLEYFAELSAMYFVGCNYPPANRAELKKYDPNGFAMIERYWGVTQAAPADSR